MGTVERCSRPSDCVNYPVSIAESVQADQELLAESVQLERIVPVVEKVGTDSFKEALPVTVEPCSCADGVEALPRPRTTTGRTVGSAVSRRRTDGQYDARAATQSSVSVRSLRRDDARFQDSRHRHVDCWHVQKPIDQSCKVGSASLI